MGWMAKARWCLGMAMALVVASAPHASPILITVDTSSFAGATVTLAFDFTDGGPPDNTATIIQFTTDGTLDAASVLPVGDVAGDLGGTLTLGPGFATYLQDIALGNVLSFRFESPGDAPAADSFPDGFMFSLLDAETGLPLSDEAPSGALLIYSIGAEVPLTFLSSIVEAGDVPTGVPEPRVLALFASGLLSLAVVRAFKH